MSVNLLHTKILFTCTGFIAFPVQLCSYLCKMFLINHHRPNYKLVREHWVISVNSSYFTPVLPFLWGAVDLTAPSCRALCCCDASYGGHRPTSTGRCPVLYVAWPDCERRIQFYSWKKHDRAARTAWVLDKCPNPVMNVADPAPLTRSIETWSNVPELSGALEGGPRSCSCCCLLCAELISTSIVFSQILSQITSFFFFFYQQIVNRR